MEENKKSLKMPIIILVAVLVILLVGAIVYIANSNKPKNIFMGAIDSVLSASETEQEEIKTVNATMGLGININSQDPTIAKVAEYINKAKIILNAQMDMEQEKELVKLGLDYDNETVLDAKISYKNQEDNAYAKIEDLFDKTFSVKIDEEAKAEFNLLFEEAKNLTLEENEVSKKVEKIFKETISDNLKDEYFTQENVELDINGEKVNTRKSVLTLTDVQLQEVISGIVKSLKENEEFINCFDEKDKAQILNDLNELEASLNEINSEITESTFIFNLYTKGINQEFLKFEIVLKDQLAEYVISILKNDTENYEFLVTEKYYEDNETRETLKGTLTIKDVSDTAKDIIIKVNVEEFGEITVNVQLSYVINEPVENIDTSNSVNIEEITEADQQKLMTNLQNMKIYKIVQDVISTFFTSEYSY